MAIEVPIHARRPRARSGPAMAPDVSMDRWKPNAFPRTSGGADSGEGKRAFIAVERPYPAATNRLRWPASSDHRPDRIFMKETTPSARPSTTPRTRAPARRTPTRQKGRIGRIISLLTSVNRDTRARRTTFTVRPYARALRGAVMVHPRTASGMEEERDADDRVHHDEEEALVPVAPPVRGDGREDPRRQGDRYELENLEVPGPELRRGG